MVLKILAARAERRRAAELAKARSDEIDRQIKEEARTFRGWCDLLLVGLNEPEMFSIVKQVMIICQDGYSREELLDFRLSIWRYLLDTSRRVVQDLRDLGLEPVTHANKANCERILNHEKDINHPEFFFQPGFANAVQELWADDIIPVLFDTPTYFPFADNAAYFFPDAHRVTSKEYVPSNDDILRAPVPVHKGLAETCFPMGQLSMRLYLVTSLISKRKKWMHYFEGVTKLQSLLIESIVLLESVINSRWFSRTSVILLLTGIEGLKVQLPKVPLESYFPDYTGGIDINKAAKYILWRFTQVNRARLTVHLHLANVFDTNNLRLLFMTIEEMIMTIEEMISQNALKCCVLI
ncbi:Guanine nucleotide binding protein (G-protein), alpha subunit [Lactarius tabidus]